uniref:Myosin XVA n=1 Tax=Equus caballus TaxID=9796 RepID=A0A9L0R8A2_HORSE
MSSLLSLTEVLPDYLKGLFSSVPASRPSEQQLQQVSKLASLQHRAKGHLYLPSVREVQEYIPAQLYCTTAGSAWLNLVSQHRQQTQALSPHQARTQFLGADGQVPPEGDPVDADPAAHSQLQLPLCGDHTGGRGSPAHHAAAAGAGPGVVSCGGCACGEPAQCPGEAAHAAPQ